MASNHDVGPQVLNLLIENNDTPGDCAEMLAAIITTVFDADKPSVSEFSDRITWLLAEIKRLYHSLHAADFHPPHETRQ